MKYLLILLCALVVITYAIPRKSIRRHPNCEYKNCLEGEVRNFTYPPNCAQYLACSNGVGTVKDCPSGQLFNAGESQCVLSFGGAGQCIPCE